MVVKEFDEATQRQYLEEDRKAWNSICTILMGIIIVGLCLAVLAVLICV
jgi:CHASE3 domain sensor protein